ncbi:putative MFS-type transporter [Cyphellophora attinorum]|uniref:Putative MFS-type transporter n=1 Tax=Cyphellophora attinorum TaxID=1664694 RepID=A0A0N1HAY3_9EURO|nr:putative MFS-type transporter [Phialophora attinorum]KPI41110.1 putative MFS-type transporter [Phialophora attinorum]
MSRTQIQTTPPASSIELLSIPTSSKPSVPSPALLKQPVVPDQPPLPIPHGDDHGSFTPQPLKRGASGAIFFSIIGVTAISSMLAGLVTIALPHMHQCPHVRLQPDPLWGDRDVVGPRFMYILGTALQSVFTLACGLAKTSAQIIVFRGLAGVAIAFCLPSAVSLISGYFPQGRRRNMAFAAMGGGQPVGFAIGLVVGGVLADSVVTWRGGFYVAAGINTVVLVVTFWGLPRLEEDGTDSHTIWKRLRSEIDWTGALLLSSGLAMLSYVFAALTGSVRTIEQPVTIALLLLAVVLIVGFVGWVQRQEKLGRPAIIPNSIWRNRIFTSVCVDVFLLWGAFNAMEALLTFFFQDVQLLSATATSLRFLPVAVMGILLNLVVGSLIHRVRADWAITFSCLISCISPILTATMKPTSSYWEFVFPAITLSAIGVDVLFTASQLVITSAFPDRTQALAGGVFNTVAQVGKSVGLAISAVIANSISESVEHSGKPHTLVLLDGYRGAWWFCLASCAAVVVVSIFGLRNIGKLGVKRD